MILNVHDDANDRGRPRYTLAETEHGIAWGRCSEVEGLFGEARRGTYELFGWIPERAEALGWVGSRVWLVAEDEALDAWLLEDAESPGQLPGAGNLVLTGLDDYVGPPKGYAGPVRVHDGHRWLGSCQGFTRIVPAEQVASSLILRGLAQGDRLRTALMNGTRRALDLEEAVLEIRDNHGELLTDRLLRARVRAWHPSSCGMDLIDLELDGELFMPVPEYARPVWERWLAGPPETLGAWVRLDTRRRVAWLDLVRERACRRVHRDRPAGHAYELDGRDTTDEAGLYLALGEALNGPGGYFGGCLDALVDCLRGTFGYTAPASLLWRCAATAREHLSEALTPEGQSYDLFAEFLDVLAKGGMDITLA